LRNTWITTIYVRRSSASSFTHVIDAIDIAFVNEGAKSKVRIASLPGLEFEGSVSQVADEPRTERGVVSYPVRIKVDLPEGLAGILHSRTSGLKDSMPIVVHCHWYSPTLDDAPQQGQIPPSVLLFPK
jgi:hypothetical protein